MEDIAKEALTVAGSVYGLVLEKGVFSKDQLSAILRPENMTGPRQIRNGA